MHAAFDPLQQPTCGTLLHLYQLLSVGVYCLTHRSPEALAIFFPLLLLQLRSEGALPLVQASCLAHLSPLVPGVFLLRQPTYRPIL